MKRHVYTLIWVKSGNFGHQVNSDIHLQTVEIQMRRLLMSRLIRIFTVCLVNLFFYSNHQNMKQTRSLSDFSRPSEFTRLLNARKCYTMNSFPIIVTHNHYIMVSEQNIVPFKPNVMLSVQYSMLILKLHSL